MRYWVRDGKDVRGPHTLEELAAQDVPDSALVCPENRSKSRRESWLPLRKAKAPPRFFARLGPKVRGPYTAEELGRLPGFSPDTLLCPEGRNFRSRWNWAPARGIPALRPAGAAPTAKAPHPHQRASGGMRRAAAWWSGFAARWRRPPALPLLAGAGATLVAVLAWMHFSYLPKVRQCYHRVHTAMGLRVIAGLQERYRSETGAYAPDFGSLAEVAGPWLPEIMSENLDLETLMVKGSSDSFRIEANARDDRRTLYRFHKTPKPHRRSAPAVLVSSFSAAAAAPVATSTTGVSASTGTAR